MSEKGLLNGSVSELLEAGGEVKLPSRVSSDKAYKKRMNYIDKDKRYFTQVNDKECSTIVKTLTLPQAGVLLSMFAYMEEGKGGFLYFGGKRLSLKEFSKLTNKGYDSVKRSASELVNLGYLSTSKEGKSIYYSVNSQIATRGRSTKKDFFSRIFIVQLREVIQKASIQELGLFLNLLPYFNTRAYVICSNPHELKLANIELWNRERIAEETGLSLPTVKRLIPSMMRNGLLIGVKTWRTAIVIHPQLVSRQLEKVTLEDVTKVIENELNKKKEW
ncbi:UNVERIFIED_ORG: putative transcriptional regulator [Bacillus sp. 1751]|nr:putative transcriptional regulator [Bacillus sp. 1751]